MICLSMMPCSNCKHYIRIKQKRKTEAEEFVLCDVAKDSDSRNLLKENKLKISCDRQEKIYDELE